MVKCAEPRAKTDKSLIAAPVGGAATGGLDQSVSSTVWASSAKIYA